MYLKFGVLVMDHGFPFMQTSGFFGLPIGANVTNKHFAVAGVLLGWLRDQ